MSRLVINLFCIITIYKEIFHSTFIIFNKNIIYFFFLHLEKIKRTVKNETSKLSRNNFMYYDLQYN
jgi:hypothetical protein